MCVRVRVCQPRSLLVAEPQSNPRFLAKQNSPSLQKGLAACCNKTRDENPDTERPQTKKKKQAEAVQEAQAEGLLAKDGIMVSDYRFVDTDLSLGGLKGNHFEILLRPPPGGWGTGEAAAAVGGGVLSAAEAFRRLRDEVFVRVSWRVCVSCVG